MIAIALSLLLQNPQALIEQLSSEDLDARCEASAELERLHEAAVPALMAALDHADAEVATRSHDVLYRIVNALPPEVVARHARLALIRTRREIRTLIDSLEKESLDPNWMLASPTMRYYDPLPKYARLVELGGAAVPALLEVALAPWLSPDPCVVAIRLLAKIGDCRAVGPLIELLGCDRLGASPHGETVGDAASAALSVFPDAALMPPLIDVLHTSTCRERIVDQLRKRTRRDFGVDAAAWSSWWEASRSR